MNEHEIIIALDTLANYQAQVDYLALEKHRLLDEALPAEVKARMAEIETEFADKASAAQENINALTAQIKAAVLANGASVKGSFLHAVYAKGRVSWDGKKLDGMMSLIPALADARKEGEPSVSFRAVK
jgi:hypothetical protein